MKPSSCKAKGRSFQQWIRDDLIIRFGLSKDDCRSTSMGCGGEDIQLSPYARLRFPYSIEAKNVEKLNVWEAYEQAKMHSKGDKEKEPILFIKKNHKDPLVVVDAEHFMNLMQRLWKLTSLDDMYDK
jgi:hypothetical protein